MKKFKSKIATFALALCLIVSCMFMLTACGDDHTHTLTKVDAVAETCTTDGNTLYYKCDCGKYFSDEEAKTEIEKDSWIVEKTGHTYASTWTYNETHHWKEATCGHSTEKGDYAEHSLTDNTCECGYVVTTYTVSEADWNSVLTGDYLTNGTINVANNLYVEEVIDQEQSSVITMKSTETSMVMIMEEGTETLYQYLVNEEGVWYALLQVEDVWYGAEVPNDFVGNYTFAGGQGVCFEDRFSEFEYDEENHCYVANNFDLDGETTADTVKIYIENGKLVRMEIKVPVTTDSYEISEYVFSDYGTTTIDVPEWSLVPAGE